MKKKCLPILLVFMVSILAAADFKFFIGQNLSEYRVPGNPITPMIHYGRRYLPGMGMLEMGLTRTGTLSREASGFRLGGGFEFPISHRLAVEIDIQYTLHGTIVVYQTNPDIEKQWTTIHALVSPLYFKWKTKGDSSPYFLAGAEVELLLLHPGRMYDLENQTAPLPGGDHWFLDFGAVAGIGFELLHEKRTYFVEARYQHSFGNVLQAYPELFPLRLRTFSINIGIRI